MAIIRPNISVSSRLTSASNKSVPKPSGKRWASRAVRAGSLSPPVSSFAIARATGCRSFSAIKASAVASIAGKTGEATRFFRCCTERRIWATPAARTSTALSGSASIVLSSSPTVSSCSPPKSAERISSLSWGICRASTGFSCPGSSSNSSVNWYSSGKNLSSCRLAAKSRPPPSCLIFSILAVNIRRI